MGLLSQKIIVYLDFSLYFYLFALCACVHMCSERGICAPQQVGGGSRTVWWESILCFYHVTTGNKWAVRFGNKHSYPLNHLTDNACLVVAL